MTAHCSSPPPSGGMRRSPILMGNDQHRARCDLQQPMGNAAKQKSFQRATSDTAENDEIGSRANGRVCYRVRRAVDNHLMYLEPRVETSCLQLRDLARDPCFRLRLHALCVVCAPMAGYQFVDVNHLQTGLVLYGKILSARHRQICGLRPVGGYHDNLEHVDTLCNMRRLTSQRTVVAPLPAVQGRSTPRAPPGGATGSRGTKGPPTTLVVHRAQTPCACHEVACVRRRQPPPGTGPGRAVGHGTLPTPEGRVPKQPCACVGGATATVAPTQCLLR